MDLEFLKECFESDDNYTNFMSKVEEKGIKLADISTGDYVSKNKYTDEVNKAKDLKTKYDELTKSMDKNDNSQKITDMEKEINDWKDKYNNLYQDYDKSNKRNQIIKNGIREEFADFVYSEVTKKVTDEVDFDTAFKKFKTENTQYNSDNVKQRAGVNPDLSGKNNANESSSRIMNNIIRGIN